MSNPPVLLTPGERNAAIRHLRSALRRVNAHHVTAVLQDAWNAFPECYGTPCPMPAEMRKILERMDQEEAEYDRLKELLKTSRST